MKSSLIFNRIIDHLNCRISCTLFRKVGRNSIKKDYGYIVDFNEDFVVLQEIDDFNLNGYRIFATSTISKIRYNDYDMYYNDIMEWEGITDKVIYPHSIDLTNWNTIFQSVKALGLNAIIENEKPGKEIFAIGPIIKVTDKSVSINSFDPTGLLDKELTKFKWKDITIMQLDNRYINVFSKYLRTS
ncbi:hypothetical protein [Pedobacter sp. MC2016-24]|uniref:hypothetical protein n=1 Tax=Pedobacter sp. MC2016-24 TaxID=2780090 RepID=UPI001881D4D0|nr:hypothetical protein [Pedobacter sp. MC2016-24]MBE9600743.1 hypothetical protein [Pedobacter sp. MC2016-24]